MKKLVILNFVIVVMFFSCTKENQNDTYKEESQNGICKKGSQDGTSFSIKAVYDKIESNPGGGGVFIISLVDSLNTSGDIGLTLEASSDLNASLTRTKISKAFPVTELTIKPKKDVRAGQRTIKLHASNGISEKTILLSVDIKDWPCEPGQIPMSKKDEYILWLQKNYPQLKITPSAQWFAYLTYPGILIVEHVTLLNNDYEFRICTHITIHPYNWSMIRLRKRNEVTPFFAARQDSSDGVFYQMPVKNYPVRGY